MARKNELENKGKDLEQLEDKTLVEAPEEAPELPKAEKGMVHIRVLPYRGIGGVGGPGTVTQMEKALAEQYEADGYVEILNKE